MKRFCLAALAAGMMAAGPAHALDLRVDPNPVYVFDLSPDRKIFDVVLQNILVVNDEAEARELTGLRVELLAKGEVVSVGRAPAATVAKRAQRIAALDAAGQLKAMDFQFHLSRNLHAGERLSADARLDPHEVYLHASFYVSATTLPDTARVVAEGREGDLGAVSAPVSRYQSPNHYRAPVDGRWFVFASGEPGGHHRWVISQEYAIDIATLGPRMMAYKGKGTRMKDYDAFGQPIFAAADGVVVAVRSDRADNDEVLRQPGESFEAYEERSAKIQQNFLDSEGFEGAAGNYVLIRHAGGEHSLYAHMRQGSARVKVGDAVTSGQQIGQVGSTGNSTQPHLHFQVIDGPDLNSARGLPVVFEGLRDDWTAMSGRQLRAGDVLERD